MSDVANGSNRRKIPRRQRSIYQVHYGLEPRQGPVMAAPLPLRRFMRQVAGHGENVQGEKYTGLLQCSDGTILKPILKESQRREIEFYERITSSDRPDLVELRKFIPKYYGVKKFTYNGFEQEYIMLEDLTEGLLEPCIMDVKIGRITYDPYASAEKIKREESKYARCKQQYAFCIPGYQVYKVGGRPGEVLRAGREQGKKLHGDQVVTVFRCFLNASGRAACRTLLVQLLSRLWRLQRAAAAGGVTLRASSLLLVYDAAELRACCGDGSAPRCRPRRLSAPSLAPDAPAPAPPPLAGSPWSEALERLDGSHAFDNNYQDKLGKIKMEYRARLARVANERAAPYASLGVIDFAHAFLHDDERVAVDANFKEGLDSLVRLLEGFLPDSADRVP